ncbi:MAG: AAA family ATPase [Emcibacter sp.]|nr:AAA family ATPase [Emcibacter sp.]
MKIILISGASGSGKTTLAKLIHSLCPNSTLLCLDSYYFSKKEQIERNGFCNFDDPKALDSDLFVKNIEELTRDGSAMIPRYNFEISERAGYEEYKSSEILIVEGLFSSLFASKKSVLNVFIETDMDIALLRRINRDMKERKRTIESITEQYLNFVRPSYLKHVDKIKEISDIIINNKTSIVNLENVAKDIIKSIGI